MDLRLVSDPLTAAQKLAVLPLERAKAQARISHSHEDALIEAYICAAYDHLSGPNGWLRGCCLLEEQFDLFLPTEPMWHGWEMEIPARPLAGPVTVSGRTTSGDYEDVPENTFSVWRSPMAFARLVKVGNAPWATAAGADAIRIRFRAGFGTTPAAIPEPLKQAMALLAAEFYDTRTASADAVRQSVLYGVRALTGPYRLARGYA